MPSYAPNFTARVKVRYHAAGANHTQLWRCTQLGVAFIEADAAIAAIQDIYDLLSPIMFDDWSVLDVSVAQFASDIFLPHGTLTAVGTVTTVSMAASRKAQAVSFVGRSTAGQPAKFAQFGVDTGAFADVQAIDYRVSAGEDVTIDGVIAQLNSYTAGSEIVGSDGLPIVWKGYANTKPYDYWVKRVRNGG